MADVSFFGKLLSQAVKSLNHSVSSSETETTITVNVKRKKSKKRKSSVEKVTVDEQCQKKTKLNDSEIGKNEDINEATNLIEESNCHKYDIPEELEIKVKKKKKKKKQSDDNCDTTPDDNTVLVDEELRNLYDRKYNNECSFELEGKSRKRKKDRDNNILQPHNSIFENKKVASYDELKQKKKHKKKKEHRNAINTANIDGPVDNSLFDIELSDKPKVHSNSSKKNKNIENLLQSDNNSGEELVTEDNNKQKKTKKSKLKETDESPTTMINVDSDLVKEEPGSKVEDICDDEVYVMLEKKAKKKNKKSKKENWADNLQNDNIYSNIDISPEGDSEEIIKNMKTDPENIEHLNQQMSVEVILRESSKLLTGSTSSVEEKSKKKKRTSNSLVSIGANVHISSYTLKEVLTCKDNVKIETSYPAKTRPSSGQNTTLISDLYSVPDSDHVGDQIYRVCRHILQLNIAVSPVNVAYQKNYRPYDPLEKEILKSEYGAVFGKYWEEEDNTILFRYKQLKDAGIIADEKKLMDELKELNKLYTRGKGKEARNILGLYVGQDMPSKLAEGVCQQLMRLVTGTNLHTSQYKTPIIAPNRAAKARPVRWSHDEDTTLVERVLRDSSNGRYKRVEMVDEKLVNWTEIGEELPNRTRELARERWMKIVKIKLINDDQEPEAELEYQRALLEAVALLKAKHKKEIDWKKLEQRFHPKSSSVLAYDFHNLTRYSIHQDLQKRVQTALDKVDDMDGRGFNRALERKRKQGEKKSLLIEFYHSLLRL